MSVAHRRKFTERKRSLATAAMACTALQCVSPACAQDIAQDAAGSVEAPPAEIVVTGLRAALNKASQDKKGADAIKEVIDAEDIGKLPDTNIAETLQRVTGVQIDRELGEGSELSVRGFSENRIELNGETQVGTGAGGAITFRTIPSEAFGKIEVIKTQAADQVEGALGAIVRLSTRKPLDLRKPLFAASAEAQYAERADRWAPAASLTLGDRWELGGGELGALLTATYKSRRLRQDLVEVQGWEAVNAFGRDLDGDGLIEEPVQRDSRGAITDLQDGVYVPLNTQLRVREQDRQLFSRSGSLQYRPTTAIELYFDGTFTRNTAKDRQFQYVLSFSGALEPDPGTGGNRIRPVYQNAASLPLTSDRTVLSAMLGQVNPLNQRPQRGVNVQISGNSNPIEEQSVSFTTGLRWDIAERLKLDLQFARGEGRKTNDQTFTNSGLINFNDNPFVFFDFGAPTAIPTLAVLQRTTGGVATTAPAADNRIDLLDPAAYRMNNATHQISDDRELDRAIRADLDYRLDAGPITTIEAGFRLGHRNGRRSRLRGEDTSLTSADGTMAGQIFPQLDSQFPGLIVAQPYQDLLDGASGDFPHQWMSLDSALLSSNLAEIRSRFGIVLAPDVGWGFDVSQDMRAAYLKLNYRLEIGSIPVSGNAGVRYVHTDQVATGAYTIRGENPTVATFTQRYGNWLPSFNLRAELNRNLVFRFGAAQAMTRPSTGAVAPLIDVNFSGLRGNGGNPLLRPQRTVQLDAALEAYWGRGNYLAVAGFYKDFKERIESGVQRLCLALPAGSSDPEPEDGCAVNEQLIAVNTRINSGAAKVKGFELAWQQVLTFLPKPLDGLGFIANYTFVDANGGTSRSDSGRLLPFQDLSRHSYNLIGFFEKGPLTLRAAYTWRSAFFDERSDTGEASMAHPYGQLDASVSVDLTRNVKLSIEGINLLNAPERRYQELAERPLLYQVNDRRILFGLRIRN